MTCLCLELPDVFVDNQILLRLPLLLLSLGASSCFIFCRLQQSFWS